MNNLIYLLEDFQSLVKKVDQIHKIVNVGEKQKIPPKNMSLSQAIIYLKENGLSISESKMYKLTSKKEIPFKTFGNRLVFNSKELNTWINLKLNKLNFDNTNYIVKSALNNRRNGK